MSIINLVKSIFESKPFVDADTKVWIFDTYAWALRNFGADVFFEDTILVLPTNEFFPEKSDDQDQFAALIFERVKKYAGMEKWECELVAQTPDVNPVVASTVVIQNAPKGPAGTFDFKENGNDKAVITYNPSQVSKPEMLIATYAHELSHYLSTIATELPPGGEEAWEPVTDLIAVFMGFGVFLANTAFTYESFTDVDAQGWTAQIQGYLSQDDLVYAISIFCVLKNVSITSVEPFLKRSLRLSLRKAMNDILKSEDDINRLKSIKKKMKSV